MDCGKALKVLQDEIDGRLPANEAAGLREHLASCRACAGEKERYLEVGEVLRALTAVAREEKGPQLESMWIRVRGGIEEQRHARSAAARFRKWLLLPAAAALAVAALLFYPSGVSRAPFHPSSFDVSVEDLESDAATVALVDRGEDLPRVIWIIENDKT